MLKKIFIIILSFTLLSHCEYKPVYSNQNNLNYKIIITDFSGDKDMNNLIAANLKRNSKDNSNEIINISFNTKYSKNVLAKNVSVRNIPDYGVSPFLPKASPIPSHIRQQILPRSQA